MEEKPGAEILEHAGRKQPVVTEAKTFEIKSEAERWS